MAYLALELPTTTTADEVALMRKEPEYKEPVSQIFHDRQRLGGYLASTKLESIS